MLVPVIVYFRKFKVAKGQREEYLKSQKGRERSELRTPEMSEKSLPVFLRLQLDPFPENLLAFLGEKTYFVGEFVDFVLIFHGELSHQIRAHFVS